MRPIAAVAAAGRLPAKVTCQGRICRRKLMKCPRRRVTAARRVRGDRHRHVSLRFVSFRAAGAFGGTWIDHGRSQRAASQIPPQHLVPVNVSAQDGGKTRRNGTAGNDIGSVAKDISGRTDCRPLHRLMHAEQPQIRGCRPPSCAFEKIGKALANPIPLVREAGDRDRDLAEIQDQRLGPVEDEDARVSGKERIRDRGALVVPGDHDHRYAGIGEPLERGERAQHERRLHPASEEDVTTVNDEIDLTAKRRFERALEPGEEAGQTEMRVGQEENAKVGARHRRTVQPDPPPARSLRSFPRKGKVRAERNPHLVERSSTDRIIE